MNERYRVVKGPIKALNPQISKFWNNLESSESNF